MHLNMKTIGILLIVSAPFVFLMGWLLAWLSMDKVDSALNVMGGLLWILSAGLIAIGITLLILHKKK